MAELVDATHSKCVAQKAWGFESLYGHHDLGCYSFSNPCVSNFKVRLFSVTVRTVFSGTPVGT